MVMVERAPSGQSGRAAFHLLYPIAEVTYVVHLNKISRFNRSLDLFSVPVLNVNENLKITYTPIPLPAIGDT